MIAVRIKKRTSGNGSESDGRKPWTAHKLNAQLLKLAEVWGPTQEVGDFSGEKAERFP